MLGIEPISEGNNIFPRGLTVSIKQLSRIHT